MAFVHIHVRKHYHVHTDEEKLKEIWLYESVLFFM